ncbi:MAG: nucleoside triphosphate pyrophosphohydrolase [Candidatus Izemoplasma sp.]|jgi:predicted house-cleaning noncanonical NTP pyrophosphatase (MazG superfamily)
MIVYNKLVRDNIPYIIKKEGKIANIRILDDAEYLTEVKHKLVEEAKELLETKSKEQCINELADVYEVLDQILMTNKIDIQDIEKARIIKNRAKGAFEDKIFLESVE